jgi:HEAT repeat protein
VTQALDSTDPDLRRVALGAATRLGILDSHRLLGFFEDPHPSVRRRALELAARRDPDPDLAAAVAAKLDDDTVAEVAAFALGEMGGHRGLEALGNQAAWIVERLATQARSHTDVLCRESAVAALGALGAGREAVLAATGDVATVRRRAVVALANFEGADVEAALTRALDDRDWQVRQIAEDLLAPADPDS